MTETHTIRSALAFALNEEMERDPNVFIMGEDIAAIGDKGGVFGVTRGMLDKFGAERVINTPISESAFLGQALGAAMTGLRPVVEIMFCDFLSVCMDPLVNQAAKMRFQHAGRGRIPLVVRTTYGAGDGSGPVHSQSLYGLFAGIPGLKVALPVTPTTAYQVMKSAFSSANPVIVFEHKGLYDLQGVLDTSKAADGAGQTAVCHRGGKDVTIVAFGNMVHRALEAAATLEDQGISTEVIDPVWASPVDWEAIIRSVEKTGRLLVVDEGLGNAGMADFILSGVCQRAYSALKTAPKALTPLFTPVPYAPVLENHWMVKTEQIIESVKALIEDANG